jgi:transcriptional regulator with XRE-family HTH domain
MEDVKLGAALRAVRIRKRWRQADVAEKAGVPRTTVSRIECGELGALPVDTLRACMRALGVGLDLAPRWRGGELDRLVNRAHVALHEDLMHHFARLPGWRALPEVAFSVYGERGVIDILAWHEATDSLLVVELKTLLVDPEDLVKTMGIRTRLALRIAADQGWAAQGSVSRWVVLTDTRRNRRHVWRVEMILRAAFPSDGRAMRGWLRSPSGPIGALSFWPCAPAVITSRVRPGRGGVADDASGTFPEEVDAVGLGSDIGSWSFIAHGEAVAAGSRLRHPDLVIRHGDGHYPA